MLASKASWRKYFASKSEVEQCQLATLKRLIEAKMVKFKKDKFTNFLSISFDKAVNYFRIYKS
jgi:hypothetical protein